MTSLCQGKMSPLLAPVIARRCTLPHTKGFWRCVQPRALHQFHGGLE